MAITQEEVTEWSEYLLKSERKTKKISRVLRRCVLALIVLWGSYILYGIAKPYFEKEIPPPITYSSKGSEEEVTLYDDSIVITSSAGGIDISGLTFTTTCANAIAIDTGDNSITFIESD